MNLLPHGHLEVDDTVYTPGWVSYKFHPGPGPAVYTSAAYGVRPVSSQSEQPKKCPNCGASKFQFSSGRNVCLYCHGEV